MLERIKPIMNLVRDYLKTYWTELRVKYGIWGAVASAAVALKLIFFYGLIGVTTNFFFVWLITAVLTYLLFASFKNKWIPAIIYLLLTVLMFCDVTYSSFFNRYLSVNMLGAAGFLGDITASIKQVLKPWFFILFADVILVFVTLVKSRSTSGQNGIKLENDIEDDFEINNIEAIYNNIESAIDTDNNIEAVIDDNTDEIELSEEAGGEADGRASESITDSGTGDQSENFHAPRLSRRRKRRENKKRKQDLLRKSKKPVTALLILMLIVFNITNNYFITSLSNQEIYSYHIKDIVNKLSGNSVNGSNSGYMYSVTDTYSTEKNGPLFGVAKGRNLIVIQIESLQNLVLNKTYNGQEITPNLNQIINGNTIYFDHYYQQIGSGNTSDAEFATNNSIYGTLSSYTYKLYADNYFKGLPKLLKEQGYETAVYHAHEDRNFWNRENAYKSIGFDTFRGGIGGTDKGEYNMTEWMGWGLTDSEFFKQTVPYIKEMSQPFYSFVITLSNHHPFEMLDKYRFIKLKPEDKGTIFGNYLNSAAYTDYAIGQFIQELKDAGLYDNSVIAFYGDHLGLPKSDDGIYKSVSRFLGKDYDFDTMMNIPLIITVPGADKDIHQTVSTTGGQMDFLPTIAYLMGFDSLDTVYLGHNLLTEKSGFVAEQTYMTKGSFFQDDIVYEMSRDGVFENGRAWNQKTGKPVPVKDCYDGYMKSMGIVNTCEYILKNDVLRKIYKENQDTASAFSNQVSEVEYPDKIAEAGAPDKKLIGTNSLEAMNASYDAGYRNIKLNVCWTEDKEAVLLNSWEDLSRYFDTDKNSPITLEQFHNLKMKDGLTPMDYLDLISWVKDHPDVKVFVQAERSADYFMKCMSSYDASIMNQFISVVPGMVEYSGLYPSVLNIEIGGNSVDQLLEFIKLNHVGAISMSKADAEGKYKSILKADCTSYILDEDGGFFTKND